MRQDTEEIFSKVNDRERTRLFKDMASARTEVVCKGTASEVYHLHVERTTPKDQLVCSVPFGLKTPKNEPDLTCQVFIGGERYFFKSQVYLADTKVVLEPEKNLYHLQRRQSYRIKIPESYPAKIIISELNGMSIKLSAELYDLSSGGCRALMTAATPALKSGDHLKIHLFVGNREPIEVDGTIRHLQVENFATKTTTQTFGIELNNMSALVEGKLFSITMDLHREFFSRMKL